MATIDVVDLNAALADGRRSRRCQKIAAAGERTGGERCGAAVFEELHGPARRAIRQAADAVAGHGGGESDVRAGRDGAVGVGGAVAQCDGGAGVYDLGVVVGVGTGEIRVVASIERGEGV